MNYFGSASLPKLPREVGHHPMDGLIYALRHMVAEYVATRQQAYRPGDVLNIVCVSGALTELGRTFHNIASEYRGRPDASLSVAGQIFEAGNRYYDMAVGGIEVTTKE